MPTTGIVSFEELFANPNRPGVRVVRLNGEGQDDENGRPYFSARDVIMNLCNHSCKHAAKTWQRLPGCFDCTKQDPQLCKTYQFQGEGQASQPVLTYCGVLAMIMVLPGERAGGHRLAFVRILIRYLAGEPTMAQELDDAALSRFPIHALALEEPHGVGVVPAAVVEVVQVETVATIQAEARLRVARIQAKQDEDMAALSARYAVDAHACALERRLVKERCLLTEQDAELYVKDVKWLKARTAATNAELGLSMASMAAQIAQLEAEIRFYAVKPTRDAMLTAVSASPNN